MLFFFGGWGCRGMLILRRVTSEPGITLGISQL